MMLGRASAPTADVWLMQRTDAVGGTKRLIDELTGRLMEAGISAQAVYLRSPAEGAAAGIGRLAGLLTLARDFARLRSGLRAGRPRVVVTFTPLVGAAVALARGTLPGLKVVATLHAAPSQVMPIARWLDRLAARKRAYASIVACASSVAAEYAALDPAYGSQMTVIANGVPNSSAPRGGSASAELRAQLGIEEGTSVAFGAGRLTALKNFDVLVRALASAEGWELVLAGEGEESTALARTAETLGVRRRVHLLGGLDRDAVAAWLSACDLFTLPSFSEGLSLALLEAMSRGTPIAASDIPANRDPLAGGGDELGWLLPPNEAEAWAAVMQRVREDPTEAAERGLRARQRQREAFDKEAMIASYVHLIEACLDS